MTPLSFFKNLFHSSKPSDPQEDMPLNDADTDEKSTTTHKHPEVPELANEGEGNNTQERPTKNGRKRRDAQRRDTRDPQRRQRRPEREPREYAPRENAPKPTPEEEQKVLQSLLDFTVYVARALVDSPDEVSAEILEKDNANVIMVSCAKKDAGKLIGKSGRIIAAMRILVSGSASRSGVKLTVDLKD